MIFSDSSIRHCFSLMDFLVTHENFIRNIILNFVILRFLEIVIVLDVVIVLEIKDRYSSRCCYSFKKIVILETILRIKVNHKKVLEI
jgi:hypothetical protein